MAFTINTRAETYYNCNHISTLISSPEPKRSTVSVPLSDGILDLTGMLSTTQFYEPRTITLGLELRGLRSTWPTSYSTILADLHGQNVVLVLGNDTTYYWSGYCTVSALEDHGASAGLTLTIEAFPFKKTVTPTTVYTDTISGDVTVTVTVSKMRGFLEFTTSAANFTVTYDTQTWTLPQGTSTAFGLVLVNGSHTLTVHGTGTVTITMEEATL